MTTSGTPRSGRKGVRPPTLMQVAERAGVSRTAASFVLTGRTDQRLSQDVFRRVLEAARELGYRPNQAARTLRTGASGTVALISDFISTTSTANAMVRGALEALRGHGKLLFTVETLGDPTLEQQLVENLLDRTVDGFIYASMFTRTVHVPEILRSTRMVLLNCVSVDDFVTSTIVPDEVQAGRHAVEALLSAGHRDGIYFVGDLRFGVTGNDQWSNLAPLAHPQRLEGITTALELAGVTLAGKIPLDSWSQGEARTVLTSRLAAGFAPRALICANDEVAFGAYQALHTAGRAIPDDVSVVSFDDTEMSGWLDPGLTSVGLPHRQLGRAAVELLLGDDDHQIHQVAMPVHTRESIAPPAPPSDVTQV